MGTLKTMDGTGDTRISWDRDKEDEVDAARKTFDELKKKGYLAFGTKRNGDKAEVIKNFDSKLEEILMVPHIVGG